MKIPAVILAVLALLGFVGLAQAVPPGLSLNFAGGDEGIVTFSGQSHYDVGMRCTQCHMARFDVSRSARIEFSDHRSDQYCFGCHNGETAFGIRRNCGNCHAGG
jgi:c(7)-type cytochrome triheme protein